MPNNRETDLLTDPSREGRGWNEEDENVYCLILVSSLTRFLFTVKFDTFPIPQCKKIQGYVLTYLFCFLMELDKLWKNSSWVIIYFFRNNNENQEILKRIDMCVSHLAIEEDEGVSETTYEWLVFPRMAHKRSFLGIRQNKDTR